MFVVSIQSWICKRWQRHTLLYCKVENFKVSSPSDQVRYVACEWISFYSVDLRNVCLFKMTCSMSVGKLSLPYSLVESFNVLEVKFRQISQPNKHAKISLSLHVCAFCIAFTFRLPFHYLWISHHFCLEMLWVSLISCIRRGNSCQLWQVVLNKFVFVFL